MTEQSMIERVARVLCECDGYDPDQLEPGNTPYHDNTEVVDGRLRGGPAFRLWRLYAKDARAALEALREPTEGMLGAAWPKVTVGLADGEPEHLVALYQAMMDAALSEKPQ
jgi:hypothetical protein